MLLSAFPLFAYSGGQATSRRTILPVVIDGDLAEASWNAVKAEFTSQKICADPQNWYQIKPGCGNNTNKGGLRVSRGQVDDDNDLSIFWMTLWDYEYLYFGFEVTDENCNNYNGPYEARSGNFDGFIMVFDTRHDAPLIEFPPHEFDTKAVSEQSENQPDDVFFAVAPLTDRGYPAVFQQVTEKESPILNNPDNGHLAAKRTDKGYNVEVRIPWSVFESFYGGKLTPEENLSMGFDVIFIDIDPIYDAPFGGAMAWSSDFEADNCPAVLGELFLSEQIVNSVFPMDKAVSTWGSLKN
jgi:hypothetical protein